MRRAYKNPTREREKDVAEQKVNLSRRVRRRLFNRAVWRKSSRFTLSGLLIALAGFILIDIGLFLNTGAYSAEGLLVGFGAILMLVGIVRLLIGFINPASPEDLRPLIEKRDEVDTTSAILGYEPEDDHV